MQIRRTDLCLPAQPANAQSRALLTSPQVNIMHGPSHKTAKHCIKIKKYSKKSIFMLDKTKI